MKGRIEFAREYCAHVYDEAVVYGIVRALQDREQREPDLRERVLVLDNVALAARLQRLYARTESWWQRAWLRMIRHRIDWLQIADLVRAHLTGPRIAVGRSS